MNKIILFASLVVIGLTACQDDSDISTLPSVPTLDHKSLKESVGYLQSFCLLAKKSNSVTSEWDTVTKYQVRPEESNMWVLDTFTRKINDSTSSVLFNGWTFEKFEESLFGGIGIEGTILYGNLGGVEAIDFYFFDERYDNFSKSGTLKLTNLEVTPFKNDIETQKYTFEGLIQFPNETQDSLDVSVLSYDFVYTLEVNVL